MSAPSEHTQKPDHQVAASAPPPILGLSEGSALLLLSTLASLDPDTALKAAARIGALPDASSALKGAAKALGIQALKETNGRDASCALSFVLQQLQADPMNALAFAREFSSLVKKKADWLFEDLEVERCMAIEKEIPGFVSELPSYVLAKRPEMALVLRAAGLMTPAQVLEFMRNAEFNYEHASDEEVPDAAEVWQQCREADAGWSGAMWEGYWSQPILQGRRRDPSDSCLGWLLADPESGDDVFEWARLSGQTPAALQTLAVELAWHAQRGQWDGARALGRWWGAQKDDFETLASEAAAFFNLDSPWVGLSNPKLVGSAAVGWLVPLNASARALCCVSIGLSTGDPSRWRAWSRMALGLAESGAASPLFELKMRHDKEWIADSGRSGVFSEKDHGKQVCLLLAAAWSRQGSSLDPVAERWFWDGATKDDKKLLPKMVKATRDNPAWQGCHARCEALELRVSKRVKPGLTEARAPSSAPRL
jgi:hypothetical protein